MVLHPELLERARKAGAGLEAADRAALLARAEYHAAVRRLHLAGGSLREVAQALRLSHQRVQQIVSGAGGTWWRRVWRSRRIPADTVCTWCGRPPSEVAKLVAGPHVFICDRCVASAEAATGGTPAAPFGAVRTRGVASRCAFCGKRPGETRTLVTAPQGHVCGDCLRICRDIMEHASA